ncbi:DNA cytosine methyltransferase [Campylobacter iguaniorum]|uniref:DNA cytosine methyltransferase n=1 Tax=Campylobacter iguaniorum TaxID=1244531 RepID=UPI00073A026D|nr:DNA cytosine methyltransferase [Campylobacter iguaniorum]
MQILDLFSGIGGFSLGFESANFKDYDFLKLPAEQESVSDGFFKTTAFCEIDIKFKIYAIFIFYKIKYSDILIFNILFFIKIK